MIQPDRPIDEQQPATFANRLPDDELRTSSLELVDHDEPKTEEKVEVSQQVIKVGVHAGAVVMSLSLAVESLGLTPKMARILADRLRECANDIEPLRKRHKK